MIVPFTRITKLVDKDEEEAEESDGQMIDGGWVPKQRPPPYTEGLRQLNAQVVALGIPDIPKDIVPEPCPPPPAKIKE